MCSYICNEIIKEASRQGSSDNLSCIFICFENFFKNKQDYHKIKNNIYIQSCNEMIV